MHCKEHWRQPNLIQEIIEMKKTFWVRLKHGQTGYRSAQAVLSYLNAEFLLKMKKKVQYEYSDVCVPRLPIVLNRALKICAVTKQMNVCFPNTCMQEYAITYFA